MTRENREDTIAAIATARGAAAIGIIRISGPDAHAIVGQLVARSALRDRELSFGVARDDAGQVIDEVLAVTLDGPRTFTGEDSAEVHGHGGIASLDQLLDRVIELGARLAEPGEFSRRALANGKMDVLKAEAIQAMIASEAERGQRIAASHLRGELGAHLDQLRVAVNGVRAEVEVELDFPEEGVEPAKQSNWVTQLSEVSVELQRLAKSFDSARAATEGLRVVLVGPVNAGKSSLFNALVGHERALVSDQAGTTRDYIEGRFECDGIAVTVVDTAGDRIASSGQESELEVRGRALAADERSRADLVIHVVPCPVRSAPELRGNALAVATKSDLGDPAGLLSTSVTTGLGIDRLKQAIIQHCAEPTDGLALISARQQQHSRAAGEFVVAAATGVESGRELDCVAEDLRRAADQIDLTLGREPSDQMLDELFARFCIGK